MKDTGPNLDQRIAKRVRQLRAEVGLSLESLANKSGVSRSMISLVERGESSPTATLLEKLAAGLNVPLASLFDAPERDSKKAGNPVARRKDQVQWQDPDSGYRRRNLSPPGIPQPMQIVEVHFPAGRRVAFESSVRDVPVYQQVWILDGEMHITVGRQRHRLRNGDCLAMQLDGSTMFHNPGRKTARYVVITANPPNWRKS